MHYIYISIFLESEHIARVFTLVDIAHSCYALPFYSGQSRVWLPSFIPIAPNKRMGTKPYLITGSWWRTQFLSGFVVLTVIYVSTNFSFSSETKTPRKRFLLSTFLDSNIDRLYFKYRKKERYHERSRNSNIVIFSRLSNLIVHIRVLIIWD